MSQKQATGKLGEEIAKKYLKKKGYKILEQHYCLRGGEIDLIAKQREVIVFIEVKTRTSAEYGAPEEAVDYFKQKSLFRAMQNYFWKEKIENQNYRFDIISINLDKNSRIAKIKHFENVELAQ